jgi:hypothetical protein
MGKYRILSIGFQFPGGEVDFAGFQSDQSLLDADIVVFEPSLRVFYGSRTYQVK